MLSRSTLRVLSILDCSKDNDRTASGSANGDRVYGKHVIRCFESGNEPKPSPSGDCSVGVLNRNLGIDSGKWSKPFHGSNFTNHTGTLKGSHEPGR